MGGQFVPGTMTYVIEDAGTQTGPAGGVRFSATRNGMVMTGTITITIWWINEDNEVTEPGEEFRLPFTAVRIK